MKKLKTVVVEDERLPRLSLLAKLEDFRHSVEVVDACDNYDSARMSILHPECHQALGHRLSAEAHRQG